MELLENKAEQNSISTYVSERSNHWINTKKQQAINRGPYKSILHVHTRHTYYSRPLEGVPYRDIALSWPCHAFSHLTTI